MSDKDTLVRTDADWKTAAEAFTRLKAEADAVATRLDEAKARLIGLASHPSEKGNGVQVTRFWKQGAVDYKKVPELTGVDLEAYRAAAREEVRISLVK